MVETNNMSSRQLALARRHAMSKGGKAAIAAPGQSATRADQMSKRQAEKPQPRARSASPAPAPVSNSAPRSSRARVQSNEQSTKVKSLARRRALSTRGKSAESTTDRVRTAEMMRKSSETVAKNSDSTVAAAPKTEQGCGCGCNGKGKAKAERTSSLAGRTTKRKSKRTAISMNPSKAASLARRKAMSTRGKAAVNTNGMSQAQTARAANPDLSSRELAQTLREQRSKRGKTGQKATTRPTGKIRKAPEGGAKDATWKVGASETVSGQTVTGTMVGRDKSVTGDEASTCRDVTGTEYMGADVFRDFCEAEPTKKPSRSGTSQTMSGNSVTGNRVGRSASVTGDEPGTCKNVTGTEYVGASQAEKFCGNKSEVKPVSVMLGQTNKGKEVSGDNVVSNMKVTGGEAGASKLLTGAQYVQPVDRKAPAKVAKVHTLAGSHVTGNNVGRSTKMTGDEAGSCKAVTGDEYIGREQYENFCEKTPAPQDRKVGVAMTDSGRTVTGTMNGRSGLVTGNEPGTCKSVTGTPYSGMEQANAFCEAPAVKKIEARTRVMPERAKAGMTGIQPGVGGVMTGDSKGSCEAVSGTPYVGQAEQAAACGTPAPAVATGEEAFDQFSVEAPSHASATIDEPNLVTGSSSYEGNITGPFGMAGGKVSGTEEARFGKVPQALSNEPEAISGRLKSRVSGEGMDAGSKITGDDWDRGERVTGTEGASARMRNITRQGPAAVQSMAMNRANQPQAEVVKEEVAQPVSRVTGASGNYGEGSLITYSGGARG